MTIDVTSIPDFVTLPSHETWRQIILEDFEMAALAAGIANPPVQEGGEWWLMAGMMATGSNLVCAQLLVALGGADPVTATGDKLDEIRDRLGLPVIPATGGSGSLTVTVTGSSYFPAELEFVAPGGLRGVVSVSKTVTPTDTLKTVAVQMTDVGAATNLAAGTTVRWVDAPINVFTAATVTAGFDGGQDAENDDDKRQRILEHIRNAALYGMPEWVREQVLAIGNLAPDDCYVYRAAGGPSTFKVVPVMNWAVTPGTRGCSDATIAAIKSALSGKVPPEIHFAVQNPTDSLVHGFMIGTLVGTSSTARWADTVPGPTPSSTALPVSVSSLSPLQFTNCAASPNGKKVTITNGLGVAFDYLVNSATLLSGTTWTVTVGPVIDNSIAVGDFVQPRVTYPDGASTFLADWQAAVGVCAPGEQLNSAGLLVLPQCVRTPRVADGGQSDSIYGAFLRWQRARSADWSEVTVGGFLTNLGAPIASASPAGFPNPGPAPLVWEPGRFAVYPRI